MPQIVVNYKPNAKQKRFHACGADEVLYGGAKGGGKSCALVMEALAYGLEHAGARMGLFRETYEQLDANLVREWKSKVPKELYTYNESKHCATLVNGTQVLFRYIRNRQDAEHYQGQEFDWIGIDEITFFLEDWVQILLSCMRSAKGFPTRFRATCNPGGIGHIWVKERYILPTNYGQKTISDTVTGNTIAFIPATVYDNSVLMANDPAYVKRLENLPEAQKRAFLFGDWDVFEGQYYPEWRQDIHVKQPYTLPREWKRFRSLDYGLDCCCCHWWAVDSQGRLTVYRELHESNLNLSQAAKRIIELSPPDEVYDYTVASPDLWNRRQDTGKSGMEVMLENGLTGLIPADDRRVEGWRILREYLAPYEDEFGQKRANIEIFHTCFNAVRNIPALVHDDKKPEDAASEPHEITHAPESIRYGVMSRPQPYRPQRPEVNPPYEERVWKHIKTLQKPKAGDMGTEW